MSTGLLEKLLRETRDRNVMRIGETVNIRQIELLEPDKRIRQGVSICAEYADRELFAQSVFFEFGAFVHRPNHRFDPKSVEAIAREFVEQDIKKLRVYAYKEGDRNTITLNTMCFDMEIGKTIQRITSYSSDQRMQWIRENEALFREILAIFNGRNIRWKECGTILPDEHQARITPERIRDVYVLLFEHNLYPNIQASTRKEDKKSNDTGVFCIQHHPWQGYYTSEINFKRWFQDGSRDYRTMRPKDIVSVEEAIEMLGETIEGKTFKYNGGERGGIYRVENGKIIFVSDDYVKIGNDPHNEQTIKNLIRHYFRAFYHPERPANLREMLQYETFKGFIHGVMQPPVDIPLDKKNNLEFLFGHNTGITYRRMIDKQRPQETTN